MVSNDRGLAPIDDLQDAIAGVRPARARIATRLAGPRVGAFWKPGDPALISLPGPAWLGNGKPARVERQNLVLAIRLLCRRRVPGAVSKNANPQGPKVRIHLPPAGNLVRT